MKRGFILFMAIVCICNIILGCNRTQSIEDAYKETQTKNENKTKDSQPQTFEEEKPVWGSLSKDYYYENEMLISYGNINEEVLKIKVLDAFYSDSMEDGGDYFKTSEWMKQRDEICQDVKDKKYLFLKVEIENLTEESILYNVTDINPYACKIGEDTVEACNIKIESEMAYDASEDKDGGVEYYSISILPQEKKVFTAGYIVYGDLIEENDICIDASYGFLDFADEHLEIANDKAFKLLHINSVRKVQNGGGINGESTEI